METADRCLSLSWWLFDYDGGFYESWVCLCDCPCFRQTPVFRHSSALINKLQEDQAQSAVFCSTSCLCGLQLTRPQEFRCLSFQEAVEVLKELKVPDKAWHFGSEWRLLKTQDAYWFAGLSGWATRPRSSYNGCNLSSLLSVYCQIKATEPKY